MKLEAMLNTLGKNIREEQLEELGLRKIENERLGKIIYEKITSRPVRKTVNENEDIKIEYLWHEPSINTEHYKYIEQEDIVLYKNDNYIYGFFKIRPSSANYYLKEAYKVRDETNNEIIKEKDITLLGFTGYRI
jgi:hypothetical protein